jgi:hypothetical protein
MKRIAALAAFTLGLTGIVGAPTVALASSSSPTSVPKCPNAITTKAVSTAIPGCMRPFTFNLSAGSSWATEVHGPPLLPFYDVFYRGDIYHVVAVHGDRFRLERDGRLFVDHGRALYHASAYIDNNNEMRF